MFKKYFSLIFISGIACIAQAQTAADTVSAQFNLDEVVVSSSKETFRHKDIPASVSLLTGGQLEKEGIRSLKNISVYVPNVFFPDYGSKLYAPVWIRGNGTRSSKSAASVGLYVDGIPYMETAAFDFEFFDIENIEVLRGPQSTLYGRNAIMGIINVTTRSPLQHQGTNILLSGGAYGDAKAGVTHYAKIGQRLGLVAGLNYTRQGGYFTNQYTGKKADERNDIAGRLRLTFRHSEKALSDLHINYEHSRQEGYAYSLYHPETDKVDSVNYNYPSSYVRDMLSAGYTFSYQTAWGSIRTITGAQYLSDEHTVDQDYSPKSTSYAIQPQKQKMLSQEVIFQSGFSRNYRWVTGAFGFVQQKDKDVEVGNGPVQYFIHDEQPVFGAALYHQSTYNNLLANGLSLTLGARLDYEKASQQYHSEVNPPAFATAMGVDAEVNSELDFDMWEFLPKAALRYELAGQAIYVSVAKGYKSGGFNSSFLAGKLAQAILPEESWNYEAGFKLHLAGNTNIDASVYYIDWKNQQIVQVEVLDNGNEDTHIRNAGKSKSKGFELSATSRPVKNLTLNANFGYTDAVFTDFIDNKIDYKGKHIPWAPQTTFAGGASYRIPLNGWLDDVTVNAQYNNIGKIYWHENNQVAQNPYSLLNGGISAGKGSVRLSLWARNILNTRYFVYYNDVASIGKLVQQGRPLTIGADLKIDL